MRARLSPFVSLLTLLGALSPSIAWGQDPEPTIREPNVLLIVDSSGSMEYRTGLAVDADGKRLEPSCNPNLDNASEKSRWIELVEVLGGAISQYRCETISRRSPSFAVDFQLPGGIAPADTDYRTAYHLPMSGNCQVRPGIAPAGNPFEFVRPSFRNRMTDADCQTSFVMGGDGLIDSFTSIVRFGLMTLDPLPDPGTGYLSGVGFQPSWSSGVNGGFSYFVGSPQTGRPVYCAEPQNMEVGVRNGAAPAWEGKMIAFGDPEAGSQATVHSRIKDVLLSTRPFGASPIAGALSDAVAFLWDDDSDDPTNSSLKYSPKHDRYVQGGCREQHIILLTDGEPNLDLRPSCTATVNPGGAPPSALDGQCPFSAPAEIISGLKSGTFIDAHGIGHSGQRVYTHIVGFATPTTKTGHDCTELTDTDITSPSGLCANAAGDKELEICCRLHEMAYYGRKDGSNNLAFFGNDQATLRGALSDVLGAIVRRTASATRPVRSPGVGAAENPNVKALRLLTSYSSGEGLWHGNIERLRWTCPSGTPVEQPKSDADGDDFNHNISKDSASLENRTFITFVETEGRSDRTIRPHIGSANDGLGTLTGLQEYAKGPSIADRIPFSAISGGAIVPNTIPACDDLGSSQTVECRDRIVKWTLGYEMDHTGTRHRCATPGSKDCSVLGDVLHSTPTIVNRPSAIVEDETYDLFAEQNNKRPMMAYVSTNDGQLHGFMLSPNHTDDAPENPDAANEKFSFIPPAVLPSLASEYPGSRLKLLDGVAVVQDVVAVAATGGEAGAYPYKLERGIADATASSNTWRTILVQSFGEAGSGYFALDITDVTPHSTTGPRFLWQITKDNAASPAPLFGKGGTPIITTVNINVGGVLKEVAVAILPGGDAAHLPGSCARQSSSADWGHIPSTFSPRARTRCYAENEPARSLTVVRLDTGEVIRSFRRTAAAAGTISASLVHTHGDAPIDAPLTGVPAAYPAGTGAIADRVFIGDRDGTLYKLDLSDSNPQNWKLKLFFDAFGAHPDKNSRPDEISQPISIRPTLSIDTRDQVTIAFATGEQNLSSPLELQYVWSLTEAVNDEGTGFNANVNWYKPLGVTGSGGTPNGEHVLGPLELFGGVLYFSTYTPPPPSNAAAVACGSGEGAIYGMDYLIPKEAEDLSKGGQDALKVEGNTYDKRTAAQLGLDPSSVVFGVAVEFAPSCYDVSEASGSLASGSRARVGGSASIPQMQLTFQTTSTTTSRSNLNFQTSFESLNLAPPKIASNIESWAAILE